MQGLTYIAIPEKQCKLPMLAFECLKTPTCILPTRKAVEMNQDVDSHRACLPLLKCKASLKACAASACLFRPCKAAPFLRYALSQPGDKAIALSASCRASANLPAFVKASALLLCSLFSASLSVQISMASVYLAEKEDLSEGVQIPSRETERNEVQERMSTFDKHFCICPVSDLQPLAS